jgi:predicted metal-dependent enzyme (double-stranded beta helix superfamily)
MSYRAESSSNSQRYPVLPGMTLAEFCREIGRVLDGVPDQWAPRLAARHLPGLLANPALLAPEQRVASPGSYGRHCVFACPSDRFSVVAMVWPPGFSSPIHDHATWCALGIYEGVIEEHHFLPASDDPDETRAIPGTMLEHRAGMVTHLPVDAPNIHAMHNPGTRPAISIHVYGGNTHKLGPNVNKLWSVEA